MAYLHVLIAASALIVSAHARSLGAANEEPPPNSDTNYAYADQQSEEYAEQPAQSNRQMRQVPNDEQGYDKDYGQENVNEESMTQVAQQAQYAARLNGDDEDADVAPKKEVAPVSYKSHNHKIKADQATLNEEADQQEEENVQRQNLETGDEAKEAVEDTYRSPRENPDLPGAASNQRNAASPMQGQSQGQEEESDEAAADTVDKMGADYQNANEPSNVQQLTKSETSAEIAGAQNAPANVVNYKEYAQEEEETDPANADTAVEVSKEEAAPAQYEQVANQPE
ncbi:Hypothetical protein NTJ_08335 [Nesidiocoris tenuis]|uniref:Uncharacterized protein n=1 Tax=Nesidiocoris tenuis TaxID=355587 RepID=A0ABN7ATL7_9HEMI|nr:Hypothetical protein NTJ_08335 [Nesidiocoris tenuis]